MRSISLSNYLENALILLELIGIKVFVKTIKPVNSPTKKVNKPKAPKWIGTTLYYKGKSKKAKNSYSAKLVVVSDDEFILKAGSVIIDKTFNQIKTTEDKPFKSLSTAGKFVSNSSVNGWVIWKNKNGETADVLGRKK
ncbi:MAG: DUF4357 domain-containing protein [Streptococcaceae bacterium]|jgi:hypothetical protein|nr:DUF4357 domain-containing protein [Streptococcaceae bacterium]